ncbi:MAG: ribosome-associated protein [Sphingobacteriales bacterium]|jgi:ribosome-associated protein
MNQRTSALCKAIIDGMADKKAKNIVQIDLTNVQGAVADVFIICHGDSSTQTEAIGDGVEKSTKEQLSDLPIHREGKAVGQWVILDYFDVVVHIFHRDFREVYNLEQYWGDGEIEEIKQAG